MATAAPTRVHPETADQTTSPNISSVDALVERLGAEVSAARERIRSLQSEAAEVFAGQEKRFTAFVTVADRNGDERSRRTSLMSLLREHNIHAIAFVSGLERLEVVLGPKVLDPT